LYLFNDLASMLGTGRIRACSQFKVRLERAGNRHRPFLHGLLPERVEKGQLSRGLLTPGSNEKIQTTRRRSMQDAGFLRTQAEMCLEVARKLSDRKAAENLRAKAAEYFSRAVELETVSGKPPKEPIPGA
jgi:hypothetical protein